jgi:regulator of PEP synthase PpsR (kinase-PPPase family)
MEKKQVNVHLISDLTCETLINVNSVIMSQFPDVEVKRFVWPFVIYESQLDEIINSVNQNPGVIMVSIIKPEIDNIITSTFSHRKDITIIHPLAESIYNFSKFLGIDVKVKQRKIEYYDKFIPINYTLEHDDGRLTEDVEEADIVIIGVSRSSKTPTSVYLSHLGYKVMNIPYVRKDLMPDFTKVKNPLLIGLIIEAERLLSIRSDRVGNLDNNSYISKESIIKEIRESRTFMESIGCHVIDVTRKSVEETSAKIISLYDKHKHRD